MLFSTPIISFFNIDWRVIVKEITMNIKEKFLKGNSERLYEVNGKMNIKKGPAIMYRFFRYSIFGSLVGGVGLSRQCIVSADTLSLGPYVGNYARTLRMLARAS